MKENKREVIKAKKDIIIKSAIAVGILAIGFIAGQECCHRQISGGLGLLWDYDPTLEEHMWKTLNDFEKNKRGQK